MKFYDEIVVYASKDVTVCNVKLPVSNKQIKVSVSGTADPVDVFLSFDNKIVGPVKSGDRIETPIIPIVSRFIEPVYDAKAIVVPRTTFSIPSNSIEFDYSIKSSMNISTTAQILVTYEGSYSITNARAFVKEYMNHAFSPSEAILQYIKEFIESEQYSIISTLDKVCDESLIANELPRISNGLSNHCRNNLVSSWARINNLSIKVRITNMSQILEELNLRAITENRRAEQIFAQKQQMEAKTFDHKLELERLMATSTVDYTKMILKAVTDVYGQSAIDPALSNVIITYLQCNPGLSYNDMANAFRKFNHLAQRHSPAELLATVKKLLPGGK